MTQQQQWRSNRTRIMTIVLDTTFSILLPFFLLYSPVDGPRLRSYRTSCPAPLQTRNANRRGDGEICFDAYEIPTYLPTLRKTASRRIFTRALHCTGVQHCASPHPPHSLPQPPPVVTTTSSLLFFTTSEGWG